MIFNAVSVSAQILYWSVHLFSHLPHACGDHFSVNGFNLRNSLNDEWSGFFKTLISINWISEEQDGLDFWKLRELCNFIPILDSVVTNVESVQLNAWVESLKLFDLVVR